MNVISKTSWMAGVPWRVSCPLLFLLVDESWALTLGALSKGLADLGFMLGSGLLLWLTWISSTCTGRLLGAAIPDPRAFGLDFAFTAVFLALLAGLWKGKDALPAWFVAALTALAVHAVLPGKWHIVAGGFAGSLSGLWRSDAHR